MTIPPIMSPMSSLADSDAIRPRVTDIIVGRGGTQHHPGNIWFRAHMKTKKQQYQLITEKTEKNQFVTSVLKEIIASGRCFYKKVSNNYCIVGDIKCLLMTLGIYATEMVASLLFVRTSKYISDTYLDFETLAIF